MDWEGNLVQQIVLERGRLRRAVRLTEVGGVEGVDVVAVEGGHTDGVTSPVPWLPLYTYGNALSLSQYRCVRVADKQNEEGRLSVKGML